MAGAGYKLFNTGDVLTAAQVNTYLQEQTVMVFADAAARTTALSGVLAEGMFTYLKDTDVLQYYSGASWVTVNTDQTPLTTKGDLFTYSTADARLAVGNNGETLLADSSATEGLRWSAQPAASNPVLNSAMQVWQRGTSFTGLNGNGYSADRWKYYNYSTSSMYVTRETSTRTGFQYSLRFGRTAGNTSTADIAIIQDFESINSYAFAGKTVTLSFYAKKGANWSDANTPNMQLRSGTGTDQTIVSGYTGSTTVISGAPTLTTDFQRFSYTGTISSSATQIGLYFGYTPTGTAGADDWMEVTGVQVDIGNVALPFRTQGVTLAGELAACQRYYYRAIPGGTGYIAYGTGVVTGATQTYTVVPFPVVMRTAPTALEQSGTASNYAVTSSSYGITALSSVPAFLNASTQQATVSGVIASGGVAGQATHLVSNATTSSYLAWSAEL